MNQNGSWICQIFPHFKKWLETAKLLNACRHRHVISMQAHGQASRLTSDEISGFSFRDRKHGSRTEQDSRKKCFQGNRVAWQRPGWCKAVSFVSRDADEDVLVIWTSGMETAWTLSNQQSISKSVIEVYGKEFYCGEKVVEKNRIFLKISGKLTEQSDSVKLLPQYLIIFFIN